MARNTRTFTDIDLNFKPAPMAYDKKFGAGTISIEIGQTTVNGVGTRFKTLLKLEDNLYVNGSFIGKVKSIDSDISLTLYKPVAATFTDSEYQSSTPADITIKTDENAIKASIRNLISTMNYERPFNSELGSQARAIMFENMTPMTEIILRTTIMNTIRFYEPRVNLTDVVIDLRPEQHSAEITIFFTIINTTNPIRVSMMLYRSR